MKTKYYKENINSIINKNKITFDDFSALLSFDNSDTSLFEALAVRAKEITDHRFGKVKGLYIPLYLSNYCDNSCAYCGFKKDNQIERNTLTLEQIKEELRCIYNKGFRNILLVSGELSSLDHINYIESAIKVAASLGFQYIAIEVGAFDDDALKRFVKSGANSFVLYQETYHKDTYKKVHLKGKKKDYEYRLKAVERALLNGFKHATLGFLVGLYDPIYEVKELFKHLRDLRKRFKDKEFVISLPRITHAVGVEESLYKVDDKKFAQILMSLRLAFNDVPIYLSTRESEKFRDGMLNICVTHLSVESKTCPGGYLENNEQLEQFKTIDNREIEEITKKLKSMGYGTHLKDWQMELNR